MGQIFYDMGFLSTTDVHECSATDLIAGYVGQTGPKTIQMLEKALGKVLFVDEAYRLGQGGFAKEAIDELVDSLTKPRYAGKIIVILAGYEDDMNNLLQVNQGLASRFSEEVIFTRMNAEDCWVHLQKCLAKSAISVAEPKSPGDHGRILSLFTTLSELPNWANGRDVQTLARNITNLTFRTASKSTLDLCVSHGQISEPLEEYLVQCRKRAVFRPAPLSELGHAAQTLSPSPPVPPPISAGTVSKMETAKPVTARENIAPNETVPRDDGVSDSEWQQLEADKAAEEAARAAMAELVTTAAEEAQRRAEEATRLDEQVRRAEEAIERRNNGGDEDDEEKRRLLEAARLKQLAAQRTRDEAREKSRKAREEAERKRKEEAKVQTKLRRMGVCPMGYHWIKQAHAHGYTCSAGGHFVSNWELGI